VDTSIPLPTDEIFTTELKIKIPEKRKKFGIDWLPVIED